MTSLWKDALRTWLTAPRRLHVSDLPTRIRQDVGVGPETCFLAPESIRDRDSPTPGTFLGLQMSR
jgi:hypothetical protein